MSEPIVWKDDYLIHFHTIDEQHQYLFRLINQLITSSTEDYSNALSELLAYTQDHFSEEEKLMKAIDFPELERHQQIHQEFIDYLNGLTPEALQQAESKAAFESFLTNWLVQHIVKEDMKMNEL